MKLIETVRNAPYALLAAATVSVMASTSAYADNIGETAATVTNQIGNVGKLAVAGSFLGGILMLGGGLLKLKQSSENQGQNPPYSAGLWRLALGAGLVGLPAVSGMLTESVFSTATTFSSSSGLF